ncbi:hypothetical protein LCGC14_1340820 [marine sediment metagenome]|uniref:Rieske domain-containing protein n=1 Tax=marine sediment metagenome TaxID=412755 RepID=A0A0F9KDN1_9ZZZZ
MKSEPWVFAIKKDELPENTLTSVSPLGLQILLVKKADDIFAFSNKCAHMACPLSAGLFEEDIIMCSCHEWSFDIKTGEFLLAPEIKIETYDVKTSEGNLYIKI